MRHIFLHHTHHHLKHSNNNIFLILTGMAVQLASILFPLRYQATLVYLIGTTVVMSGLYLFRKVNKSSYHDPILLLVVLLIYHSIVFLIMDFFKASCVYLIIFVFIVLNFDIKRHHIWYSPINRHQKS
jgi:uncharacterized membrane protein HdeD (DUF308 family)